AKELLRTFVFLRPLGLRLDSKDNIRVIAKDVSRQRQRRILVTYIDHNDAEHEILICDGKLLDANFLFTFTYKREEYVVHKTPIGLGKLLRNGYVIADWNIRLEEDMYDIEMNVYDEGYIEDQYLLLGVFHAVLYG
ncbi:cytoplasmic protein, partial [Bacillus sp. MHSD17]|nr:cytoplasmic protein [Bacillus sp. MHSD17]